MSDQKQTSDSAQVGPGVSGTSYKPKSPYVSSPVKEVPAGTSGTDKLGGK